MRWSCAARSGLAASGLPAVAVAAARCFRHTSAREAQQFVVLRSGRDRDGYVARERRDARFAAEDEVVDRDREIDVDVVTLALERCVR